MDTKISPSPFFYSIIDAGKLLGVKRSTIYKLMDSGELRSVRIGNRRLVHRDEIERYAAKLNAEAA